MAASSSTDPLPASAAEALERGGPMAEEAFLNDTIMGDDGDDLFDGSDDEGQDPFAAPEPDLPAPPGQVKISLLKMIDRETWHRLHEIHESMCRHTKKADAFSNPVEEQFAHDPALLEAYRFQIKRPMDLRTVGEKLKADRKLSYDEKNYASVEEFALDMRQVFLNAILFNEVGGKNGIATEAKDLCNKFERRLAKLESDIEASGPLLPDGLRRRATVPIPMAYRCQILLCDIRRNPFSEWFRREEDWKALGKGYLDKIGGRHDDGLPRPMDLDRIQTKLDTRAYETAEAGFDFDRFQEDLLLVFNNAIDFNSSEVAVVRVTKTAPPAATAAAARPPTAANDEVDNWVSCSRCRKWRLLPPTARVPGEHEEWWCDLHPDPLQASCDAPEPKEAGAAGAAEAAAASKASAASSSAAASVASASSSKFLTFARLLKKAYHDGWTEKKGEEAQPSRLESIKRLDDDRFTPHSDLLDEAEMEWQEHLVKASRKLPPKAASHLAVDMQEVAPNAVHRDPWRDITGASDNVIEVKVDLDRVGQAGLAKAAEHTTRQAKKDRLYEAGALTSEIDAVR